MKFFRRILLVLAFVLLFSMPFQAETRKTINKSTKKIQMTVEQLVRIKIKGGPSARWIYKSNNTFMITRAGLFKARRAGQGKITYKLNGRSRTITVSIKGKPQAASSSSGSGGSGGGSSDSGSGSSGTVYISATGSKYHRISNCGNMNPAKATAMSVSEAESHGYTPCSRCF